MSCTALPLERDDEIDLQASRGLETQFSLRKVLDRNKLLNSTVSPDGTDMLSIALAIRDAWELDDDAVAYDAAYGAIRRNVDHLPHSH